MGKGGVTAQGQTIRPEVRSVYEGGERNRQGKYHRFDFIIELLNINYRGEGVREQDEHA